MAIRPVFKTYKNPPFYEEINTEFQFFSGFAESQHRKSIESLHHSYLLKYPNSKILEVSTRSDNLLGQRLSAFNLKYRLNDKWYSVENIFQSSKCFASGGPFNDILTLAPHIAKTDTRLKESGELVCFSFNGQQFPLNPKTFFYDWIYVTALSQNPDLSYQLSNYDAFTDIAFNPQKSINCQARSVAIYVSLASTGILEQALSSPSTFREVVYNESYLDDVIFEQTSFFDS